MKRLTYLPESSAEDGVRGPLNWIRRLPAELKRRRVYQVVAVYAAVIFVVLQAADLILPAFELPEWSYRVLVYASVLGFPVVVLLAWFFDITPEGLSLVRRGPPTPGAGRALHRQLRVISLALIGVLVAAAGVLAAVRVRLGEAEAADGRIPVAIFPFRLVGPANLQWSEGLADLVASALDGTEGLRVLDPWSLWSELREGDDVVRSPDPVQAASIARPMGARRVVLGSVVVSGARADITVRLYDPRFARALETFTVPADTGDLPGAVERVAVEVITRFWGEDAPASVRLEPNLTRSAEALKAYLAGKSAMRRGLVDSASSAIQRAIAIDTAFPLALAEAVTIGTWRAQLSGDAFSGFFQLLDRAWAHSDSLSERQRLRLESMYHSVRTVGRAAAAALHRIIEADSADLHAWMALSYIHNVYGWQYGADADDAVAAIRRVLQLDSTYAPALVTSAWLAAASRDSTLTALAAARLERADTSIVMVRSTLRSLRALGASDAAFDTFALALARSAATDWILPLRYLRIYRPDRADALLDMLWQEAQPGLPATLIAGERARLWGGRGHSLKLDSALATPAFAEPAVDRPARRMLVVASLAGLGGVDAARRSVQALERLVPPDSALAYFRIRPSWWVGWLAGAWNAQHGDTLRAWRWHRIIGTFPAGGTPSRYREALQADIEARLAVRRGDQQTALQHARAAYDDWSIHTENAAEAAPELAIRFHLARLLDANGRSDEAEPLFRSFTPPIAWFAIYTPFAWIELAEIAERRGDLPLAIHYYTMALRLWENGGPDIEPYHSEARSQLARLMDQQRG